MGKNSLLYIITAIVLVGIMGFAVYSRLGMDNNISSGGPVISKANMNKDAQEVISSKSLEVERGVYYFKPNEIKVKAGEKVIIVFNSIEGMHDFVIDDLNIRTKQINAGESETIEFIASNPGTYEFYCSVGNHRAMGMKGILIVE